ncbi:MAG: Gx transporter family protein [Eubacteriales bacterium]|jgi:heptaprenyl diphosphate synthase|nr:Gx transporter family protein [Eubacteriales bacterium]
MDKSEKNIRATKRLVLTALLFGTSLILAFVEGFFPAIPIPGVKLGLSNVVVMYALFFLSKKQAFSIAILKGMFVFATRGPVAGVLSLSGGIVSLVSMIILSIITKRNASYLISSVTGAVFHNVGQFMAVSLIYSFAEIWIYLPWLVILGIAAGAFTSVLLKIILPALDKSGLK